MELLAEELIRLNISGFDAQIEEAVRAAMSAMSVAASANNNRAEYRTTRRQER